MNQEAEEVLMKESGGGGRVKDIIMRAAVGTRPGPSSRFVQFHV